MAETSFYIGLNIKTADGFETYGKFFIGNYKDIAYSIFGKLKGSKKVSDKSILTMDLMETSYGLPINIQVSQLHIGAIAREQ